MSDDPAPARDPADGVAEEPPPAADPVHVEDLVGDLDDLKSEVESDAAHREIRELRALLAEAAERGLVESGVRRLDPRDAAEAFVGSVIFASPLLVEDGVFDIADYLFETTVAGVPIFLVANTLFVVVMTYALIEWTGRDRTEADRLLGVVPARLVMILVVSFAVAALLMTIWGRVGGWQQPAEAVARVNVLWTVGSLGAALGDIVAEDAEPAVIGDDGARRDDAPPSRHQSLDAAGDRSDGAVLGALHDRLAALEAAVEGRETRREVERIEARTNEAVADDGFGDHIRKYTGRDIAEAFVGSIFFSIPFLVEDGVFDVADYFLSFRVGGFPVFLLVNAAFVLFMISALVYWAGPQDVAVTRPLFGVVPRRLVGIAAVSFLTAAALMTMWGRVEDWQNPVVAVARVSAVWTVASFGAALGDILPGESSGDDINDDLADLGDQLEDLVEGAD